MGSLDEYFVGLNLLLGSTLDNLSFFGTLENRKFNHDCYVCDLVLECGKI